LFFAACSSSTAPLPVCSPSLTGGGTPSKSGDGAAACSEAGAISFAKTGDLSVDGYTTLSTAYTLSGTVGMHGVDVMLPYKGASNRSTEIAVLVQKGKAPAHAALVSNVFVDDANHQVRFHLPDVATVQLGLPTATLPTTRHFTYRAIGGVSMGGIGSSMNFWLHPDKYDAIGVMGADPGPDLTYSLGMIHDFFLGGFCAADTDGVDKIGQLCPVTRKLLADQGEEASSFENFLYQAGDGVGLTLSRNTYIKANRDLARALGNGAYGNADSPYLPPGVGSDYIALSNADACSKPVVLKNFFDKRYNPDGSRDVITFCDGNDGDTLGIGKFDPSKPATNPVQILLAVDVNKNGVRDSGEPVIVQGSEPWKDVGTDGMADADEPGYDPTTNPDPNGDDYHYLWNPTGTENNWRYDQGEPYDDVGIDGVPMSTGGCQAAAGVAGCYDYGEGNGKFDYAPYQQNWRGHDPRSLAEALSAADMQRLNVYYDAGIRDFFNAQVSSNSLLAAIQQNGIGVRAFDGFPILDQLPFSNESGADLAHLDWKKYGRGMYVRYGDPDLSEADVEASGDGRHVGTALQAVHRAQALLFFLAQTWPGGDRKIPPPGFGSMQKDDMFTASDGRVTPYTIVLPPGYMQPENANLRYPVVYFMHGYGMEPSGLAAISAVTGNAMVDESRPESQRMQKFILVFVDGKCRPGGEIADSGPLPTDGDLCEEGTFYADHAEGTAKGEMILGELEALIDQTYRTAMPADVTLQ
jgi:S-formylglutathione hydrolase FrmB